MDYDEKVLLILSWIAPSLPLQSLKTLSLVSHAIAECVHPELFRSIVSKGQHARLSDHMKYNKEWKHANHVRRITFFIYTETKTVSQNIASIIAGLPLLRHVAINARRLSRAFIDMTRIFRALDGCARLSTLDTFGPNLDYGGVPNEALQSVGEKLEEVHLYPQPLPKNEPWATVLTAATNTLRRIHLYPQGNFPVDTRAIAPASLLLDFHFPKLTSCLIDLSASGGYDASVYNFISRHSDLEHLICPWLPAPTVPSLHQIAHLQLAHHQHLSIITEIISALRQPHLLRVLDVPVFSQEPDANTSRDFGNALLSLSGLKDLYIRGPDYDHESWEVPADKAMIPPHPTLERLYLSIPKVPFAALSSAPEMATYEELHMTAVDEIDHTMNYSHASIDNEVDRMMREQEAKLEEWAHEVCDPLVDAVQAYAKECPALERFDWSPRGMAPAPLWQVSIKIIRDTDGVVELKGGFKKYINADEVEYVPFSELEESYEVLL